MQIFQAGVAHLPQLAPLFDAYRQFYRQPGDLAGAADFLRRRFESNESVVFLALLDGRTPPDANNVIRLMFHPDGLRPSVENWESVALALIRRMHREAVGHGHRTVVLPARVADHRRVPSRQDVGALQEPDRSDQHQDHAHHTQWIFMSRRLPAVQRVDACVIVPFRRRW